MARTKEEREQRRLEAKARAEQRKAAKAAKAEAGGDGDDDGGADKPNPNDLRKNISLSQEHNAALPALNLPIDALAKIMRYLPAREWGALSLTCTGYNHVLGGCRLAHISSRLMRRQDEENKQCSSSGSMCLVGGLQLCVGRKEAQVCAILYLYVHVHQNASHLAGLISCTFFSVPLY